jgi:hypothetical protein
MAKGKKARPAAGKKQPAKKKPAVKAKKSTAQKSTAQKSKAQKPPSLGRPTVSQEEKLFLLFREDFHARQIFEFLRAETVRDLEQFSAEEIVRRLSQPIRQSVQRIRIKLAQHHRCLRDDQAFALEQSVPE